MKCLILSSLSLLLLIDLASAQSGSDFSSSKSYPPQSKELPSDNSVEYYRTETGSTIDVKGLAKTEAERKKLIKSMGYKYHPIEEGTRDYIPTGFEMPHNEILSGCIYAATYSYPSICLDDNGKEIFNYEKGHGQAVLDQIIKKQNKKGRYNRLPKK